MTNAIKCPKCGEIIEISQVFREEIEKQVEEKSKLEIEDLKRALDQKNKKEDERIEENLKLRDLIRDLQEKDKEREIEKQKALDEERKIIEEKVSKEKDEQNKFVILEYEKKLMDMKKSLEEANRKAQQGSQQLQGEVLELNLEESLRHTFVYDSIEPVGKGVHGADITQIVKTPKGTVCGTILWESKRTKAWANEWVAKIKSDMRESKADVSIIVTMALPKEIKCNIGNIEDVWVCDLNNSLILAELIRQKLIEIARAKYVSKNTQTKAEEVYEYINSNDFVQQVKSIVEVFKDMQEQINKEKSAFEKIWKIREAQAQK